MNSNSYEVSDQTMPQVGDRVVWHPASVYGGSYFGTVKGLNSDWKWVVEWDNQSILCYDLWRFGPSGDVGIIAPEKPNEWDTEFELE